MVRRKDNRFLLLYATQTGQAKAIAEEISVYAPLFGLFADLHCLSRTSAEFILETEKCVVFVVSTSGDGGPPDSAVKFFRRLSSRSLVPNHLEKVQYCLLGLGDSNYVKFCNFGIQLDKKLQSLWAKKFYPTGYGDDAYGVETVADPWIKNLWPALRKQLSLEPLTNYGVEIDIGYLTGLDFKSTVNMSTPSKPALNNSFTSIYSLPCILGKLSIKTYRMPKIPEPTLTVSFEDAHVECASLSLIPDESLLVGYASPLAEVELVSAKRLTFGDDVKKALELTFKFKEERIPYQPGDAFGFICENPSDEVEQLLKRLQILHLADVPADVGVHHLCSRKNVPNHLKSQPTLRRLLSQCVEIRAVPKKILLRTFAEYCDTEEDKQCLEFLSSLEGAKFYTEYVRKPSLTVLDVLQCYKSCLPPVEKLLEYLPVLKPRFYSVASSPLIDETTFTIVFNVLEMKKDGGRCCDRQGVCTGWFNSLSEPFLQSENCAASLVDGISALSLKDHKEILVYRRQNLHFHMPTDLSVPLVMIGPGVGVSPFIGFLKHREKLIEAAGKDVKVGATWLFYGCRYKLKDFLYKEELERFRAKKMLSHLEVSHSREPQTASSVVPTCYVHENIVRNTKLLANAVKAGCMIYVCGDADYMAHNVSKAFTEVLAAGLELKEMARAFVFLYIGPSVKLPAGPDKGAGPL